MLVGTLAGGERAALRRFQYACNPLAILVSSVHGQAEPFCFLFVLAAFAVILRAGPHVSGRRASAAGILLGLGIAAQTWPAVSARRSCSHCHHGAAGRSSWPGPPGYGAVVRNAAGHRRHASRQAALPGHAAW